MHGDTLSWGVGYRLSDVSVFDRAMWDEIAELEEFSDGSINWESDYEYDWNDGTGIAREIPGEVYPHGIFDSCIVATDDQIIDALRHQFEGQDLSRVIFGVQVVDTRDYLDEPESKPFGWRVMTRVIQHGSED